MITLEQFKSLFPKAYFKGDDLEKHYNGLLSGMFKYEIIGHQRECYFLAQCAHESQGFSRIEENLNYTSPERLLKIFPRDFKDLEDAKQYAGKPENIANRVYAKQPGTGNGDESSGDGWRYRGMGPIQLTGKNNQERFLAEAMWEVPYHFDGIVCDTILMRPFVNAYSAAWLWNDIKGNGYADKGDFKNLTKRINGTSDPERNGLADRLAWLEKIEKTLP